MERSADDPSHGMTLHSESLQWIAAQIAYDGTDYYGFQYQSALPSIQGTLETALDVFCKRHGRVIGSGRTDTGVHARGQVVAVLVEWKHSLLALQRAWNVHLPPSIVVNGICQAPIGFHPRFSALQRTYRYYVVNRVLIGQEQGVQTKNVRRSPLTDRFAWYEARALDVEAMNRACEWLIGEHDFASFGQPTVGESTVRRVDDAHWLVVESNLSALIHDDARTLVFTITANAFLRHMVRNVVGLLLEVGRSRVSVEDVNSILLKGASTHGIAPAPSQGLALEAVTYPDEFQVHF
jgi:tRNA pseudouridine38-40 synthase